MQECAEQVVTDLNSADATNLLKQVNKGEYVYLLGENCSHTSLQLKEKLCMKRNQDKF
jgi:hypothetical protein